MSSSPTRAQLQLSSSADSLSIEASESPNQVEVDRQHYKVYRFIDSQKTKYVGRCWSVDPKSAALKLGTRGLPRLDCVTMVLVEEAAQMPGETKPKYKYQIRQVFGEITPLMEAKYTDKSKLSSDGRMKYKEILSEEMVSMPELRNSPSLPIFDNRSAPVAQLQAEFMMVPVLTQVPKTLGFSNPWSLPSVFGSTEPSQPLQKPNLFSSKRSSPSSSSLSSSSEGYPRTPRSNFKPQVKPIAPPSSQFHSQVRWTLNPTQRYAVSQN